MQVLPLPSVLYHVTPMLNALSIRLYGLDPVRRYPDRVLPRTWMVNEASLMWALAHTSARHGTSVNNLVVYRITERDIVSAGAVVKRHGRPAGLFHTDYRGLAKNSAFVSAEFAMHSFTCDEPLSTSSIWDNPLPF